MLPVLAQPGDFLTDSRIAPAKILGCAS